MWILWYGLYSKGFVVWFVCDFILIIIIKDIVLLLDFFKLRVSIYITIFIDQIIAVPLLNVIIM